MNRKRGFSLIELVGVLIAAAALVGAIAGAIHIVTTFIENTHREGVDEGRQAALREVADRDNKKLLAAQAEILRLQKLIDDLDKQLARALAEVDDKYQQGVKDGQARTDSFIAGVHDGSIILRDPGTGEARNGCARSGDANVQGAGDPAGPAGAPRAKLSVAASDFLLGLTGECDAGVRQLSACQDSLIATVKAIEACRTGATAR